MLSASTAVQYPLPLICIMPSCPWLCRAIDDNQFTGTLPPEWGAAGAFPQLYFLSVGDNLTGTVPFEWGQLPSLEYL